MDLPLSPSLVFSFLLASLYGAVFHFIWGKRWRDLAAVSYTHLTLPTTPYV